MHSLINHHEIILGRTLFRRRIIYSKEPNEFFKSSIDKLSPDKLLLPCEGEGRNVVYAATKHWQIDAFDQNVAG